MPLPEIIIKQSKEVLSQRRKEGLLKLSEIIQWGRRNPVAFASRFFGIELLDSQVYVFMNSWITPDCVWCQCRGSGKTTLGAPFIMAKSLLFPNHQSYILAGDGSQSKEMFLKIEKIAKKEIESFLDLTDVFINETVKNHNNKTGFSHDPNSFRFDLWNGSKVNTLNSVADNLRSNKKQELWQL